MFQAIPFFLPKTFFKKIDNIVNSFIWDYKNHRISKKHLCKSKINGGLALPNFLYYFWAVQIKNMNFWWVNMDHEPMWLKMEKEDCLPFNVGSILFAPKEVQKKIYRDNPIIYNNRRIWKQIVKTLHLDNLSLRLPIMNNPLFKPSILDGGFRHWDDLGIKRIEHLYRKGKFLLFQELQDIYGLSSHTFV